MSSMSGKLLRQVHVTCYGLVQCSEIIKLKLFGFLICSGHRIGTAEVESALVSHPKCAEAAVVAVEHEVLSTVFPPCSNLYCVGYPATYDA